MRNLILLDKFPVALTVMLGLLSYNINSVVDTILKSPIIEYRYEISSEVSTNGQLKEEVQCVIQNLSTQNAFKDLTFNFLFDEESTSKLFNPSVIVVNPSSLHNIKIDSEDSLITEYVVHNLQPNQKYKFKFYTLKMKEYEDEMPKIFLTTNDSVKLLNSCLTTWIIRNYVIINVILVLLWLVVVILYLFILSKKTSHEK